MAELRQQEQAGELSDAELDLVAGGLVAEVSSGANVRSQAVSDGYTALAFYLCHDTGSFFMGDYYP
jgi:hypothetical protein